MFDLFASIVTFAVLFVLVILALLACGVIVALGLSAVAGIILLFRGGAFLIRAALPNTKPR
jgi:hypothetical protein